jgi:glyoxylase-like metal-dependent hydrolase (beta-lactamase superfamily II)
MEWQQLSRRLYRYRDSCMVYAIAGDGGMVIVNAGTGAWLSHVDDLPGPVHALLCTHHFRDHSAGAVSAAARLGVSIGAPYWERELFADAEGHFARRETYIIYDNIWDRYGPIEDVPVDTWLMDWDRIRVAGVELTVVPTPGVTPGAVSLLADVDGKSVLFCGELIHSPGKLRRVAPLQYNYNDLPGAILLFASIADVRSLEPDLLAPSMGPEMISDPDGALEKLAGSLAAMVCDRPGYLSRAERVIQDEITPITPHLYKSTHGNASSYFLISESGKALAVDYGYHSGLSFGAAYPFPRNRRARLHGLRALRRTVGIESIDTVIVTHFHDDHVAGIPLLQRLYGTRCWAGDNFAFILANPAGYAFPCTWPEPIDVEAQPTGVPLHWEEYEFVLHPMSGHTEFSTAVEFAVDGETILATGDQYFLQDFDEQGRKPAMHNHVYRNGAVLTSFEESQKILDNVSPTVILPGHGEAYRYTKAHRDRFVEYGDEYRKIHEQLLPLDAPNFDVDSRAGWLEPYRLCSERAQPVELTAHVRNPFDRGEEFTVRLVTREGLRSADVTVHVPARGEGIAKLVLDPPAGFDCRRMPVALEMVGGERRFGQVAEALLTIGRRYF